MQTGGGDRLLDHCDFDLGSGHTACCHVSPIYTPNFVEIGKKLFVAGWMNNET